MDRDRETGLAVIVGVVLVVVVCLCALCGCKTQKETTTETIIQHDTVFSHHTDTLNDVRVVSHTDTLRSVESHYITLSANGDTIKEIHHYHDIQKIIIVDSTFRYKAERDSLRAALQKERSKATKKEKRSLPPFVTWVVLSVLILIAFVVVLKSKDK